MIPGNFLEDNSFMKPPTKLRLIFCCNPECVLHEMRDFVTAHPTATVFETQRVIIVGDEEFRFILGANERPEVIRGIEIDGYRTCGRYDLKPEIIEHLEAHRRRS